MTVDKPCANFASRFEKYTALDADDLELINLLAQDDSEFSESQAFEDETHDHGDHHPAGGPRTPAGKAISSQNATKHGCRSKTLILRHEDPAEYEALHEGWWDQYQPSGQAGETLVKQLIDNHWFLNRASKRMEQVEIEMPENVSEWTDAHHTQLKNFQRYKTTAERAFHKSFRTVETYFRDCLRAGLAAQKADLMRAKIEAEIARKSLAAKPNPPEKSAEHDAPALRHRDLDRVSAEPVRVVTTSVGRSNQFGTEVPHSRNMSTDRRGTSAVPANFISR